MQKKIENTILIVTLAVLFLYFILNYNLSQAVKDVSSLRLYYIPYIILAWVAFTAFKIFPWLLAIKKINVKMSLIRSFMMMYAFFGVGSTSLAVGQLIPLRELENFKKNSKFFSFTIIFFLGVTSGIAALFLAVISSIALSRFTIYLLFALSALYIAISALRFEAPYNKAKALVNHYKKIRKSKFAKTAIKYINGMKKQRGLMAQKYLILGTALFIPSIVFESLLIVLILASFNVSISIFAGIFVFTVAVSIGNASGLPSGVGPEDIAIVALLLLFGVPGVLALSTLLIFRFLNTFLVIVSGYASLGLFKFIKIKGIKV